MHRGRQMAFYLHLNRQNASLFDLKVRPHSLSEWQTYHSRAGIRTLLAVIQSRLAEPVDVPQCAGPRMTEERAKGRHICQTEGSLVRCCSRWKAL